MKSRSGFTLIEVTVVVAIIAILATMTAVVYNNQQKSSRDTRRLADVKSLSGLLKNYHQNTGNYPVTCGLPSGNIPQLRSCTGSGSATSFYTSDGMTAPDLLSANTSFATLKNVFPNISESLKDPVAKDSDPALNHVVSGSIASKSYYLFSPDMVYSSSVSTGTQDFSRPNGSKITCRYTLNGAGSPSATKPHRYIIGIFSESNGDWLFGISEKPADVAELTWEPANGSSGSCNPVPINQKQYF